LRTHPKHLFFFFLFLTFLLVNSFFTYRNYKVLDANNDQVIHTQKVLMALDDIRDDVNRTNDMVRAFFGKGKAWTSRDLEKVLGQLRTDTQAVQQMTSDNPTQTRNSDQMLSILKDQEAVLYPLIQGPRQKGYLAIRDRIGEISVSIRNLLTTMRREEDRLLGNRSEETKQSIQSTRLGFFIARGMVLAFLITALFLFEKEARTLDRLQKAEESLRYSENNYRKAVESIRDFAILVLDPEGRIVTWNEGAKAIKGFTSSEVIGKDFSIFFTTQDQKAGLPRILLEKAIKDGRVEDEGRRVRSDGSIYQTDSILTVLKDDQGKVQGFVKVARDISDRKQLEEERNRANTFLNTILENLPNMIFVKDAKDLRFVMFNKAGEELLGVSRKDLIGRNDHDFFPKDQADFFTSKDRSVLEGGRLLDIPEEPIETKKGKKILHTKKIPVRDSMGETNYLLGISEDITENREFQKALQEKTELLDLILRNISDGIVAADNNGAFLLFNPAAERILGRGPVQGGTGVWVEKYGVFRPDGSTPFRDEEVPLARALRGEATTEIEMILRNEGHPKGISIKVSGRPLQDEKGQIRGGVVIVRDITEEKRRLEKESYTRALEVSNRELQDFVFVASHDLQEPLRKIQSFGEFLQREEGKNLGPNGNDYLDRMRNAAGRMQRLINDLLALTRVTTKAQPFVPVELDKIIREVQSDLETRLSETGGKVEMGPLPVLEADPTQMRQLFQNLIGNALKFHRHGVPPVIRISAALENEGRSGIDHYRITVEDNGIGFDNKYAEQIFKVFERLHGKEAYEGTGIGLSICRKVVERHGGIIRAEGVPGQGSRFIIELPARGKI
jgi:PAS domain S-box-containing protein